jgi:hypothetical protein
MHSGQGRGLARVLGAAFMRGEWDFKQGRGRVCRISFEIEVYLIILFYIGLSRGKPFLGLFYGCWLAYRGE